MSPSPAAPEPSDASKPGVRQFPCIVGNFEMHESQHHRDGHPIWMVKPQRFLGQDAFREQLKKAERCQGFYSGRQHAFQFESPETAESFLGLRPLPPDSGSIRAAGTPPPRTMAPSSAAMAESGTPPKSPTNILTTADLKAASAPPELRFPVGSYAELDDPKMGRRFFEVVERDQAGRVLVNDVERIRPDWMDSGKLRPAGRIFDLEKDLPPRTYPAESIPSFQKHADYLGHKLVSVSERNDEIESALKDITGTGLKAAAKRDELIKLQELVTDQRHALVSQSRSARKELDTAMCEDLAHNPHIPAERRLAAMTEVLGTESPLGRRAYHELRRVALEQAGKLLDPSIGDLDRRHCAVMAVSDLTSYNRFLRPGTDLKSGLQREAARIINMRVRSTIESTRDLDTAPARPAIRPEISPAHREQALVDLAKAVISHPFDAPSSPRAKGAWNGTITPQGSLWATDGSALVSLADVPNANRRDCFARPMDQVGTASVPKLNDEAIERRTPYITRSRRQADMIAILGDTQDNNRPPLLAVADPKGTLTYFAAPRAMAVAKNVAHDQMSLVEQDHLAFFRGNRLVGLVSPFVLPVDHPFTHITSDDVRRRLAARHAGDQA